MSREVLTLGLGSGLTAVGIASASPFEETRGHLIERKELGLHGGMQFTYRNPDRSTDPGRIVPGARSLIVGAWSYRRIDAHFGDTQRPDDTTIASGRTTQTAPTVDLDRQRHSDVARRPVGEVARYARHDHYGDLRAALTPIADRLRQLGARAAVVCDDNALVDRAAAHRAGLGWFGKNSLLLLPGKGSWFVLGTVVTDALLEPTAPDVPAGPGEGCGPCTRCMTACPTGALVSPGVLDARRCLAWLVQAEGPFPEEHRAALGGRIYGCDVCQEVCPINRTADRKDPPPPAGLDADVEATGTDLLLMLTASDEELLATYGRWYIPRREPRYLRRNALVALGNVGDGHHPGTVAALRRWVSDDDAMLAEHAQWAARRLGRPDLAAGGRDRSLVASPTAPPSPTDRQPAAEPRPLRPLRHAGSGPEPDRL